MRMSRRSTWTALAASTALVVAAGCSSGGDNTGDTSSSGDAGTADAAITYESGQPENPLVPGNTNENAGGRIIDNLFSGLYSYAPGSAELVPTVAESIESSDSKVYTVKLKDGWTFHDGTPVNADSFINAWNWTAYSPNGALNSYFMEPIAGYADLQAEGDAKPKAETMSGLKKIDDLSFEITLTAPASAFESSLGYTAFYPLPQSFFDAEDKTAWGKEPVGNGPFKFVSWTDNQSIEVTRFDEWAGDRKPSIKDVKFTLYQDPDAAYADLTSGNLDFLYQVPATVLPGDRWKQDLGERALDTDLLVVDAMAMPIYAGAPYDNVDFRHAVSMAIDRDTITKQIFNSTRTPAKAYSSPAVNGYEETCGEYCTYNPDKAKELLAKSGFSGDMTLGYNADGGHKDWTEAVCNSISQALEIGCTATPTATFAAFRKQINERKMTGAFRAGWIYDYPHIQNGLEPLYATGASSNDSEYSSPEFDAALKKAAQAPADQSNALYVEAEKLLVEDMPAVPLWSRGAQAGYSERLDNVVINIYGQLDLTQVTVK